MLYIVSGSDIFQSTHLTRGGTQFRITLCPAAAHFNPPTSREVGPSFGSHFARLQHISIHPPHARWDHTGATHYYYNLLFQSTHLTRGGT